MSVNNNKVKKKWYDYLWIATIIYLALGFFNIIFAWLGLICFITPLVMSIFGGGKTYCNKYCGRGQLMELLGGKFKISGILKLKKVPLFISSKWFRYGFLIFFLTMFANMLSVTYIVYTGAGSLKQIVTLFWTFRVPWQWANAAGVAPWVAQFSYGFYSLMLTSTLLGFITMILFRPRTWCVYCPMGTMTQAVCKVKNYKK